MTHPVLWLALFSITQSAGPETRSAANPVMAELMAEGIVVDGTTVKLPGPTLADGQDAEAARAVVRSVAGDERAVRDFLRDSVTAPFILKARDIKAGAAIVRAADLWFAVHADLADVDPDQVLRRANDQAVEAGNMRFEAKILGEADLRGRQGRALGPEDGRSEWYTHLTGRLLDRISFEATDRAVATRSPDSSTVAARTDPGFDRDAKFPNRWSTLARQGGSEVSGAARPYLGGASYAKITRLASEPGVLFVEAHFAFVEPHDWFQGNPILRSKIAVIAQDQVRQLRREIAKRRGKK